MCSRFVAAFPWDLHRGCQPLPIAGVRENGGGFPLPSVGAPKQEENSWLAQRMWTSWLEIPIDFSEVGMLGEARGWEEEALAIRRLQIPKGEVNALGGLRRSPPTQAAPLLWQVCLEAFQPLWLWPLTRCVNLSRNTRQCWNRLFISRRRERRRELQARGLRAAEKPGEPGWLFALDLHLGAEEPGTLTNQSRNLAISWVFLSVIPRSGLLLLV